MREANRVSRALVIVGLILSLVGVIDPLEGAFVVAAGTGMIALGVGLGKSPYRAFAIGSFLLVATGVIALWVLSAAGGVGGDSGRSYAWALVLLPYPVGWLGSLIGAIRALRVPAVNAGRKAV
jgi:hypothetical protein